MKQFTSTIKTYKFLATILLTICLWLTLATAIQANSGVLLYNAANGAATYGTVYADGHFLTTASYPAGSFTTGWSHILRANNGLFFFFRQADGLWATVRADQYGMSTLRNGYLPFYEARADMPLLHIVNTPNGILMCRRAQYPETIRGGLIGQVRSDGFFQVTQQPNFARWSNVVNTPNGVFFSIAAKDGGINSNFAVGRIQPNGTFVQTHSGEIGELGPASKIAAVGNDIVLLDYAHSLYGYSPYNFQVSGSYRVGGISSNGQFAIRSTECLPALAGGYVVPVALGNNLLLYAMADGSRPPFEYPGSAFTRLVNAGWAMVASFGGSGYFYPDPTCRGKLIIKQEYAEGTFAAGWHNIVNTANGVFFHNPTTGSVMVGNLDVNGNFTETQNISYWLDPGYTLVVNTTD